MSRLLKGLTRIVHPRSGETVLDWAVILIVSVAVLALLISLI